jgi:hypothetical protein
MKKCASSFLIMLSLLLCCFAFISTAQVSLQVQTDVRQIVVGDQLRYFITAVVDTNNQQLRWASFPDTFNTLEVIEKSKIDTFKNGSVYTFKQRLLLTGFDSGSFLIPPFTFIVRNKTGAVDTLRTDAIRIAVNTVPVDTSKAFKAIKGIVAADEDDLSEYKKWIIAAIIGCGLLLVLLFYFLQQRKKQKVVVMASKEETIDEKAARLLHELDQKELWQQDKVKEYYTELSGIVRQYIEWRFKTPAMELTTDELLRKAKKHREMALYIDALQPLLFAADLAKFAKANPLPQEHIETLALAKQFVYTTKPKVNTQDSIKPIENWKK